MLVQEILASVVWFLRWCNVSTGTVEEYRPIPGWSLFYDECRLCHEPVLNDRGWKQYQWERHILAGGGIVPSLKPGEDKLVKKEVYYARAQGASRREAEKAVGATWPAISRRVRADSFRF